MEIKKILWPTDLSENAATALPLVTSLSQKYGAEIHILYVLKDYPAFGASYGDSDPADLEKMRQWEQETAQNRLDMVIMASQGSEAHFDFGSVADRVIKCTSIPTLIIPV